MKKWWDQQLMDFRKRRWMRQQCLPACLREGELALSEHHIETLYPVPLAGRVDQAFRLDRGQGPLVLLDTKTRRKPEVQMSDRVQLSVYRVILEHNPPDHLAGVPLTEFAILRFKPEGRAPEYRKVKLLSIEEVVEGYWARLREAA